MTINPKQLRDSTTGFSLVELTLALGIMAFCLLGVLGLFSVGVSSSQKSINQTSATNILSQVVADLRATPKNLDTSIVYQIGFPPKGTVAQSTPTVISLGEDGQRLQSQASAYYSLNVWASGPTDTQQETVIRLMLTWPPGSNYTSPKGSVETVVALNRN